LITLEEIQSRILLGDRVVPPIGSWVRVESSVTGESLVFAYGKISSVSLTGKGTFWVEIKHVLPNRHNWYSEYLIGNDRVVVIVELPENCPPFESWERY